MKQATAPPIAACTEKFHHPSVLGGTLKGALGQALVQRYFQAAGWAATSKGIETVADHVPRAAAAKGDLRALPDLVVSKLAGSPSNPGTHALGQAFYVEVKTWGKWHQPQNFERYGRFGHVLIVWVSPRGWLGCWLSRPAGTGNAAVAGDIQAVVENDFRPLAMVGAVSLQHCAILTCQAQQRTVFDTKAKELASL